MPQLDSTSALIGAVLGGFVTLFLLPFVLNIASNLVTPKIQDWWDRYTFSTRGKSLEKLQKEYAEIKRHKDNLPQFYVFVLGRILRILTLIILLILAGFFTLGITTDWLFGILGILAVYQVQDDGKLANRVYRFDDYEKKTLARIAELEKSVVDKKAKN